jgi:hypothetical protein
VDAQRRIYKLRTEPLQEIDTWLARYRRFWESSFERLDGVLEEMKAAEGPGPGRKKGRAKR